MQFGLMSLGDSITDPVTGAQASGAARHRMIVEAAVLAEDAGFTSVNIGEHHGIDYVFSSPPVILAAIAERTTRLRLSTAVTLAANLDPWRLAEDYATVDVLSDGRVEIVAGRGNFFVSTYELFGQAIGQSRDRFDEAIELLLALWTADDAVTWEGAFRPPIVAQELQPRPLQRPHPPVWIGGGSSPETAELAARLGLRLMLPSAFGNPAGFRGVVDHYLEHFSAAGHRHEPVVGACWHANVARTSREAHARWEPRYRRYHGWMQGLLKRVNPDVPSYLLKPFDYQWLASNGPAIVGSPAEVTNRLGAMAELLGADTHLLYLDMGGMPQAELLDMVELIGTDVIPQLAGAEPAALVG